MSIKQDQIVKKNLYFIQIHSLAVERKNTLLKGDYDS